MFGEETRQDRANRNVVLALLIGFVTGPLAVCGGFATLVVHFGPVQIGMRWRDLVHIPALIVLAFMAGGVGAIIAAGVVDRTYGFFGVWRCRRCDRRLRRRVSSCPCRAGQPQVEPSAWRRTWRTVRPYAGGVAGTYAAGVPIAAVIAAWSFARRGVVATATDAVVFHAVFRAVLVVGFGLVEAVADWIGPAGHRRRWLKGVTFAVAIWPILFAFAAAGVTIFRDW